MSVKIKSIKKSFFYFCGVLIFFELPYFTGFHTCSKIFNTAYDLLALFYFLLLLGLLLKNKKMSFYLFFITIFFCYCIFITYLNTSKIYLMFFLRIIGVCYLCEYGLKNDSKQFFNGVEHAFCTLLIINFITVLLYPKGMYINLVNHSYQNWLLGYKNTHILFILPTLFFILVKSSIYENKVPIKFYIFSFISMINVILVDSSTSLVGLFIILLFILFRKKIIGIKFLNVKNYFLIFLSLFVVIVIFKLQNIFSFLIVDILHKDLTFTGRTNIWDYAIELIKQKPLFGYGEKNFIYCFSTGNIVKSTHDELLQIVYNYGIVGFLLFIYGLHVGIKKTIEIKNNKTCYIISTFFLVWFIMMITESYELKYFMFYLLIAYNINYLIESNKKNIGGESNEK